MNGGRSGRPSSHMFGRLSVAGNTISLTEVVVISSIMILGALLRAIASQKLLFMDERQIFYHVPHFFYYYTLVLTHFPYPIFFSYLVAVPTMLNAVFLWVLGIIPEVYGIEALFMVDPLKAIMPARIVSIGFGLLTIILIYVIGKRFFDEATGLIAAAFIALSSIHIQYSSFALPDVAMTFFATATLFYSLRAMYSKSTRDLILGGLFVGLTASTKYNGGLVLVPLLYSFFIILKDEKKPLLTLRNLVNRRLFLIGFVSLLTFALASGWLIYPTSYIKGFLKQGHTMRTGHLGFFGPLYVHYFVLFWRAETTMAVLFGAGIIYGAIRRSRESLLLLVFILVSFAIIGTWQIKRLHYLLFIYPALALLAGNMISQALHIFDSRTRWKNISTSFAVLVVFGWPLYTQLSAIPRKLKPDNRVIAERWIQQNIPAGSSIIVDWAYIPKLYTAKKTSRYLSGRHKAIFEKYLKGIRTFELISMKHHLKYKIQALKENRSQYLVTSSRCYSRFFSTQTDDPFDLFYSTISPPLGNPLYKKFQKRRRAYKFLFQDGPSNPWSPMKEFKSGKGPVIRIYSRRQ